MGTRLQYDLCSHVYSHYPSTAKGSLLPPLWLKYHCRSPEKTIANAEAVHLLLSLWLRTDHFYINKEHKYIGKNLRFTIYIYIYTDISICVSVVCRYLDLFITMSTQKGWRPQIWSVCTHFEIVWPFWVCGCTCRTGWSKTHSVWSGGKPI